MCGFSDHSWWWLCGYRPRCLTRIARRDGFGAEFVSSAINRAHSVLAWSIHLGPPKRLPIPNEIGLCLGAFHEYALPVGGYHRSLPIVDPNV